MPRKANHKSRGGKKDSAEKNSFNSPHGGGMPAGNDPLAHQERDPKGSVGQYGETGTPNLMKK